MLQREEAFAHRFRGLPIRALGPGQREFSTEMAIIETTPDITSTDVPANPWGSEDDYPSFAHALGSGDHKTIGRFYIGFALLFGIAAFVFQALLDISAGGSTLLSGDVQSRILTLGPLSLVLVAVVPLFIGIATFVVPLQVGANTVAFPRAAALAFWSWLFGSGLLFVSYALDGGVAGTDVKATDLTFLALAVIIVSLMLATVCILTTVVALRTPGLSLDRVPLFSWAMLVGGSLWLLTLPALLANVALVYVDLHYGRPTDFGVAANQWSQLEWAFGQPQIFVYAIPALGIIGDVLVTVTGVRQKNRGLLLAGIAAFGILSFGVYAQRFFNSGLSDQVLFIGAGLLIILPLLIVTGGFASTLRSGRVSISAPAIGSIFALLLLLLASLGSAAYVIKAWHFQTAAYASGMLVLVVGAAVLAAVAGLHLWAPKLGGGLANDNLGKLIVLIGFGSVALASVPLVIAGLSERFTGLADAAEALSNVAAVGAAGVVLTLVLTGLNLIAASRGASAGDDPWSGQTLEWATSSPPATANFGVLAEVTSPEPLLDLAGSTASEEAS